MLPAVAISPEEEQQRKAATVAEGANAPAEAVLQPLDSKAIASHPRLEPGAVPEHLRKVLAGSSAPVLLPEPAAVDGDAPYAQATATWGRGWYTLSVPLEHHHLQVYGTHAAFVRPELAEALHARGVPEGPHISRTHGIVEIRLARFGAAYSLEVSCQAPHDDARCREDAYVQQLADALVLLSEAR